MRAWQTAGGLLLLGHGVAGRWEVAVEVDPACRGRGLGRALATAARKLVPPGAHVWAQTAPGNAASVRAFLAAGYAPVGAEALLVARPPCSSPGHPARRPATLLVTPEARQIAGRRRGRPLVRRVRGMRLQL